jgi:polar amino acid transport system substrate-binding protein
MRFLLVFFVIIEFFSLQTGRALAGSAPEKAMLFTEDLSPVHYMENNRQVGIATDIVRAIFREAGLRTEIQTYPWKRTYLTVLRTPGSFVYTINRTPARENLFQWIGPILNKRTYLYRLASRVDIRVERPEDLKKYTTVAILGYALTDKLGNLGLTKGKELIVTRNKKEQVQVFLKGRADLITGNEFTIASALAERGYSINDVVPVLLMNEKGYYLAANLKTDRNLVERLRIANIKIQQSGLVQKTIARYMGQLPRPESICDTCWRP